MAGGSYPGGPGCAGHYAHRRWQIAVLLGIGPASAGADLGHFIADLTDERSGDRPESKALPSGPARQGPGKHAFFNTALADIAVKASRSMVEFLQVPDVGEAKAPPLQGKIPSGLSRLLVNRKESALKRNGLPQSPLS